jgi:hypothetical protein
MKVYANTTSELPLHTRTNKIYAKDGDIDFVDAPVLYVGQALRNCAGPQVGSSTDDFKIQTIEMLKRNPQIEIAMSLQRANDWLD